MSFFDLGGVRLMLGVAEGLAEHHPASILYYRVDDIASATEVFKSRGVKFVGEPRLTHKDERHELWLAFFNDGEENLLALMSEIQTH